MKNFVFALVAAAIVFGAPETAKAVKKNEIEKYKVKQGDLDREYWVYDPRAQGTSAKSGKRPLVLVLHGGGGRADKFAVMTGDKTSFTALADKEDLLIVFPQGYKKHWNDGRDADVVEAQVMELDDVGFISEVIDEMVKTRDADTRRIYATGPSNGGFMSNRLACDLSNKVAAVGIVIAQMSVNLKDRCNPKSPVSVLIMNGTEDPLVPYNGGQVGLGKKKNRGAIYSTADTFDFWLKKAGYRKGGQNIAPVALPDADPKDKTRVYKQDYKGDSAEVALYTVEGGGHTWPGGKQYLFEFLVGRTSHDINATQVIWDFFKRNPKP